MDIVKKIVRFDKYCRSCKYKSKLEADEPCCECLEYGENDYTDKPVKYEPKESSRKKQAV